MTSLVFVFHPATGVHRIRAVYMDAYEASGFRYATETEVASWYDERGLRRPRRLPVTPAAPRWDAPYH
jgi:hypothetical protein